MKQIAVIVFYLLSVAVFAQQDDNCGVSVSCDKDLSVNSTVPVTFTLTAQPSGLEEYQWSTGETTQSITVTLQPNTTKTITFQSYVKTDNNIITNGNFAQGKEGFTSDFQYADYHETELFGWYSIVTSADEVYPQFGNCTNKPADEANFMVCKGTNKEEMVVFAQDVDVKPETRYLIYFVATPLTNKDKSDTASLGKLRVRIDGEYVGDTCYTSNTECIWRYYNIPWMSKPNKDKVKFEIVCVDVSKTGNDFGIDEISMYEYCMAKEEMTLKVYENKDTIFIGGCAKDFPLEYDGKFYDKQGVYTVSDATTHYIIDVVEYPSYDYTIEAAVEEGQKYTSYNFNVKDTGTYVQYLTTIHGCDSIIRLHLTHSNNFDIWIPNAFLPKASHCNVFEYKVSSEQSFELVSFEIFSRQGTRVFSTTQKGVFWDGKYKGEFVHTGVYTYRMRYKCNPLSNDVCEKVGQCAVLD